MSYPLRVSSRISIRSVRWRGQADRYPLDLGFIAALDPALAENIAEPVIDFWVDFVSIFLWQHPFFCTEPSRRPTFAPWRACRSPRWGRLRGRKLGPRRLLFPEQERNVGSEQVLLPRRILALWNWSYVGLVFEVVVSSVASTPGRRNWVHGGLWMPSSDLPNLWLVSRFQPPPELLCFSSEKIWC